MCPLSLQPEESNTGTPEHGAPAFSSLVPHAPERFPPKCVPWRWVLPQIFLRDQRRPSQCVYRLISQQSSPAFSVFIPFRPPCKNLPSKAIHLSKQLETPVATLTVGGSFFHHFMNLPNVLVQCFLSLCWTMINSLLWSLFARLNNGPAPGNVKSGKRKSPGTELTGLFFPTQLQKARFLSPP